MAVHAIKMIPIYFSHHTYLSFFRDFKMVYKTLLKLNIFLLKIQPCMINCRDAIANQNSLSLKMFFDLEYSVTLIIIPNMPSGVSTNIKKENDATRILIKDIEQHKEEK